MAGITSGEDVELDSISKSVYNMHSLKEAMTESVSCHTNKKDTSCVSINKSSLQKVIDDILDNFLSSKPLKQGQSTKSYVAAESNVLSNVDKITNQLINSIVSAQQQQPTMNGGKILIPDSTKYVHLRRSVQFPELRRIRKQYLQWIVKHPPDSTDKEGILSSFLTYVETQID